MSNSKLQASAIPGINYDACVLRVHYSAVCDVIPVPILMRVALVLKLA